MTELPPPQLLQCPPLSPSLPQNVQPHVNISNPRISPTVIAKPLHIRRLEASLDINPLLNYANNFLTQPLTSSDESDSDVNETILKPGDKVINGIVTSRNGM